MFVMLAGACVGALVLVTLASCAAVLPFCAASTVATITAMNSATIPKVDVKASFLMSLNLQAHAPCNVR